MRLTGALLALLLLVQSSYILVFSTKEGLSEVTLLALGVALTPVAVLGGGYCALRRRRKRILLLTILGVALLAAMEVLLPISPLKTTLSTVRERASLAAVVVRDVRDEPFLSLRGNPIGVRLTFEAVFPRDARFDVSPTLYATEERYHHYATSLGHLAGFTVEPEPEKDEEGYRFADGGSYRFTADFLPTFLFRIERSEKGLEKGDLCLWEQGTPTLSVEGLGDLLREPIETRYRVQVKVSGNTYFTPPRMAFTGTSERRYSMKTFHGSALREGAGTCPW
jgi:hypothetical protein